MDIHTLQIFLKNKVKVNMADDLANQMVVNRTSLSIPSHFTFNIADEL